MPKTLVKRIVPKANWDTAHTLTVKQVESWSPSRIWRRSQGILRLYGKPNWRDHTSCKCQRIRKNRKMPKTLDIKVGTRNREKSANSVQWLDGEGNTQTIAEFFEPLLDQDGDFYHPMISKGIGIEEGTDYRIVDSDGNVTAMKSAPEKVRRELVVFLAETLNVPTSVKVPDGGTNVAAASRNWVQFRPRTDTPFTDDAARVEYIEKNS